MASPLEELIAEILKKVTPNSEGREHVISLANSLTKKVREAAEEKGVEAEVRIEGSVAKDTWLKEEPEIDIFMRLPKTMPREAFGTVCLEIARNATKGFRQIERFAEHPYLEAFVDEVRVNIVPCYKVKRGEWISATDRTPFHTDYVKALLDERKAGEVRLLKRFMKGVGVYGAEIKVGGFSGYLCELLVLHYGSFSEVLKEVGDWKEQTIVDYEGHYKNTSKVKEFFDEPLVMVDPVDKGRNVAAAVRKERLDVFIAASRAFFRNPDKVFFYPPEVKALDSGELVNKINSRGSTIIFVGFGGVATVPDVLWGQLYKSQRSLRKLIQRYDFTVLRDDVWSNEGNLCVFIFDVENRSLPKLMRHLGPPLRKKLDCEKFLRRHMGADSTVSGPRVEEGRWVVEVKRNYRDVVNLLNEQLKNGGRHVGVAEHVSRALADSMEVFVNDEVLKLYSVNSEFAKFLTEYLDGKPRWLI
jgi:tRNA nucleotidyltransferase (CCA-adding enzyme)